MISKQIYGASGCGLKKANKKVGVALLLLGVGCHNFLRPIVSGWKGTDTIIFVIVELFPDKGLFILWFWICGGSFVRIGVLCNFGCDFDGTVSQMGQGWVHSANCQIFLGHHICQSLGGRQENRIRNMMNSSANYSQRHTWENVGIVSLSRFPDNSLGVVFGEWGSRGKNGFSIGMFVALFGGTFCFAGWITQGKNNWGFVKSRHVFDDFFCENTTLSGGSNQNARFEFFDN